MVQHQQAIMRIIRQEKSLENAMSFVGSGGSMVSAGNSGRFFLTLKPRDQRDISVDQLIQRLRVKLAAVPGINVFMQNPPPIRIGGQFTKSLYQLTLQGPVPQEL